MRYAIIGSTAQQIRAAGGLEVREAQRVGVIFATLTREQAAKLETPECQVEAVAKVKSPIAPPAPITAEPIYTPEQLAWAAGLEDLRRAHYPLLYGGGFNLAILDTGIRETHEKIRGSIVYSKNYTSDPMRDGFNHGTGVCSIALAVAPLCGILNMKVLDDKGEGTDEGVVLAIDDCMDLHATYPSAVPLVMNISVGKADDGNPNNVLRTACRAALREGLWIIAAAGNSGPELETIMSPACEPYVIAVGSAKYDPFTISYFSSRGPTEEGYIKPDVVMFGEDISMASSESDTATIAHSGTSYSAPFVSGMSILYLEALIRRNGGERPPLVQNLLDVWLPRVCAKPSGVALGKDNDYGSGLLYGPLAAQATEPLQAANVTPAVDLSAMVSAIMVVGMIGVAMKQL